MILNKIILRTYKHLLNRLIYRKTYYYLFKINFYNLNS